jgi:hypothetical protein
VQQTIVQSVRNDHVVVRGNGNRARPVQVVSALSRALSAGHSEAFHGILWEKHYSVVVAIGYKNATIL